MIVLAARFKCDFHTCPRVAETEAPTRWSPGDDIARPRLPDGWSLLGIDGTSWLTFCEDHLPIPRKRKVRP